LESSREEITAERAQLQAELRSDLADRTDVVNEAVLLFSEYASYLYGENRPAYLEFDPQPTFLRITPRIHSDMSRGVGNMVIFCFDLTLSVIGAQGGTCSRLLVA